MPDHKFEISRKEREAADKSPAQQLHPVSFDERVALHAKSAEPAARGADSPVSSEIAGLYSQIRELVARSRREPELRSEIDRLTERLRHLQESEADALERRFEKRLRLKPGTGWAHLQRIKQRLGDD